jgi:iron-sulfur cluster repair protein YtfE (RIC family)
VYGNGNSNLLQIEMLFNESVKQLYQHMKKEEEGLFPFIREMMRPKN